MAELPVKRKRVTSDILSFTNANVIVLNNDNEKLKKVEILVNKLELEKATLESKIKSANVSHSLALEEKIKTITDLVKSKAEIQKRAIYHKERYDEATDTLAKMKEKHTSVANELRESLALYRSKINELETALAEQIDEAREAKYYETDRARQLTSKINNLTQEIESLKQAMQEKSSRIQHGLQREQELTEKINSLEQKINNITTYPTNPKAYQDLETQYQNISKRALTLESENVKLARDLKHFKGITQNIELLRAEKDSLSQKLTTLNDIRETNFQLEVENIKLKAERAAWAAYLESQPGFNTQSPESIIYELTKKAEEAKNLKLIIEQYQLQAKQQLNVISGLEEHMNDLKKTVIEHERVHATDEVARKILINSIDSFKRHISALEAQLAMYDQAEMFDMDEAKYDQAKSQRIAELEELLRNHENQLALQAQELAQEKTKNNSMLPPVQINQGPYEKLESGVRISNLLAEIMHKEDKLIQDLQEKSTNEVLLQRQVATAQEQIIQMTKSIENQDRQMQLLTPVVPTTEPASAASIKQKTPSVDQTTVEKVEDTNVRILTLLDSPASRNLAVRTSLLERLKKENADLLNQIASANTDADSIIVPKSTLSNLEAKNQELETTLQAREKRIERLHRIWEAKVQETSSQIRQLLGYNVIFRNDGVTRLESILVDPTELAFIVKIGDTFDESEKGMLRMVGARKEHYMEQLEDIYRVYIIQDRNIPAFLSAAAQEFYVNNKQQQQQQDMMNAQEDEFMDEEVDEGFEPYDEDTRIHNDSLDDEPFTIENEPARFSPTPARTPARTPTSATDLDGGDLIEQEEYTAEEEDNSELLISSEIKTEDNEEVINEDEQYEEEFYSQSDENQDFDDEEEMEGMEGMNGIDMVYTEEEEDDEEEEFSSSSRQSEQGGPPQIVLIDDDDDEEEE